MTVSVLTLVRDREAHLRQLVEGLRRSRARPDELVVVRMGEAKLAPLTADFPIRIERLETDGLPLALARNRAADLAYGDILVFLDVDCIPMADCLGRLVEELEACDGFACADVRYLGPGDAPDGWREADLRSRGRPHPARSFPLTGIRRESNPGLFWSLAFAVRRSAFWKLGGFDEAFEGYGAEDTDFGFRAAAMGLPLLFVGGAVACHQHHEMHEPPVQHLDDIVRNARLFHGKWGRWPMEGWLAAFAVMGLIDWTEGALTLKRRPTPDEILATRVDLFEPQAADRNGRSPVHAA